MRSPHVRALHVALALALVAGGCKDDPLQPTFPEDVDYAPSLGVDLSQMDELDSGVYIQTLVAGDGGPAEEGAKVIVDYTVWIPDGTQVDQGTDKEFTLDDSVIEGFRLGVIGMRKGETRLIVSPSTLGYGAAPPAGSGIPVHSVLIFKVVLKDLNPQI